MAVEYKNQMPPGAEEAAPDTGADDSGGGATEETASLPMSILGGKSVSPGDVVRLEVVSVDDQAGTVSVKYAEEPAAAEAPAKRGMESMAAEFD